MKQPNAKAEYAKVDEWNANNKVGVSVSYRRDIGEPIVTTTRSAAEMLRGHTAVIWLNDISGCVALSRVTAVQMARAQEVES
jgi:hypothetical protein